MTSFYLCFIYFSTLNLYLTKYCHKNQIKLIWIKILKPGWRKSRGVWNGKTLHFCLRCAAFLQALPQTRCFAAQTQLRACSYAREAVEMRPIFSIPHSPAFSLPGFSNFVHIPTLTVFRCRLFFAGTGRNNKTIFYIPHTTTIILCDNLHFPFFHPILLSLFEHSPYAESEIIFLQLRLPLRVYQLKCCHHTLS